MSHILMHGLGQTGGAWEEVRGALLAGGVDACCPDLLSMLPEGGGFWQLFEEAASFCDRQTGPLHLCGLSLGGLLALGYAKRSPERVGSLVLIGTPCPIPRRLLQIQQWLFRAMPERSFTSLGLSKSAFLTLTDSMKDLAVAPGLEALSCPCLILCGARDRVNRNAAGRLHEAIPGSALHMIPGAGHEVDADAPAALAEELLTFWTRGR